MSTKLPNWVREQMKMKEDELSTELINYIETMMNKHHFNKDSEVMIKVINNVCKQYTHQRSEEKNKDMIKMLEFVVEIMSNIVNNEYACVEDVEDDLRRYLEK